MSPLENIYSFKKQINTRKMKFRKQPVVVDAVQFTGDNEDEIISFTNDLAYNRGETLGIPTREGHMEASKGDWIIKGIHGEFYPCKPDIFEKTYEPVESPTNKEDVASDSGKQ